MFGLIALLFNFTHLAIPFAEAMLLVSTYNTVDTIRWFAHIAYNLIAIRSDEFIYA